MACLLTAVCRVSLQALAVQPANLEQLASLVNEHKRFVEEKKATHVSSSCMHTQGQVQVMAGSHVAACMHACALRRWPL